MNNQIELAKKITAIMLLSDKVEQLIIDFNPIKNAHNTESILELESLANYIQKGQSRFKRVRKVLMDRVAIKTDSGDAADFISDEIDLLIDKHITIA